MKIIHCAPFNTITKSGGALYANPIKISLGLIQNNCFVHNFDYRDIARYFSFFKNKKSGAKKMNIHFLKIINDIKPDLIIFGHAELISKETFESIQKQNIKMMFWYNDIPFPEYLNEIKSYFSHSLATAYTENSYFLPNLVHHSIEKRTSFTNNSWENDLLFSGRNDEERSQLIKYIKNKINCKSKFIGDTKKSVLIGEQYFQKIVDSKICLNHNRNFTLQYKWFTSDRLMHILGNGSFSLSTPIINGEDFFEDKLEYYSNLEELKQKTEYFLENAEERLTKSKWLHARVHQLFNAKRIGEYLINLHKENTKKLNIYEWWND
ncbi:glycosyltransferase [Sulfurospirillum arcachonense]|uniref:glycosyltransferase family protein n=1 Tax=Sulfurospirillum arcachonense TaxID=57666 RepID=UPI0004B4CE36|nr:glycosyltransferase [Sulfurospirillum arcachonense]